MFKLGVRDGILVLHILGLVELSFYLNKIPLMLKTPISIEKVPLMTLKIRYCQRVTPLAFNAATRALASPESCEASKTCNNQPNISMA